MVTDNLCPVCGYEMAEPPRDYNICPSCGTEFGLHDRNSSIEDLQRAWLATGPAWWSANEPQPEGWNPMQQLARMLFSTAKIPVFWNDYSMGVTIQTAPSAADVDHTKFGYRLSELPCR
jgi:hypothetical protein